MKRISWLQIGAVLSALFIFYAKPAWPQSSSRQAMTWFESGLRESGPQQKIAAYSQAVALDPSFVEAWFNLGMVHQEQKDYARAEEYFRKAYEVKPEKLETALKLKIVYALAEVYNKSGKLESYEKALHQAKALASSPEMLARLSFELGRLMYQRQRYDQALTELQEGRHYVTKDREHYENLIVLAEKALRLEKAYVQAEREKAGGNLKEARARFEQIHAESPKFR
ncbi:MAG: tetratricopeptide repeat protein, partial [candidate division KSB1 bacterium]